jgi:type IV pilus assembly protein PilW
MTKFPMPSVRSARLQLGVTLVELMVAITIGLVISLAATVAYITGIQTQNAENDMARLQESARFGFMLLGNEIKKAGYHNLWATPGVFLGASFGQNGTLAPVVRVADGLDGAASGNNFSDSITVSFFGDNDLTQPTLDVADGRVLDCVGNPISRDMRVVETLSVANDATNDNEPTLFCQATYFRGSEAGAAAVPACAGGVALGGSGACAAVPLISGVESMKLLYGEDTDGDNIVNRYVSMGSVGNRDNILSVMVSVVIRTTRTNTSVDTTSKTIHHFSSLYTPGGAAQGYTFTTPVDGRIRFPFTSTIALRNFGA